VRKGNLVVPESMASLPVFAELVVEDSAAMAPTAATISDNRSTQSGRSIILCSAIITACWFSGTRSSLLSHCFHINKKENNNLATGCGGRPAVV
jgi:hypothetical protein